MKMLLIQEQQVMNGFCYAFCKALLEKLEMLMEERRALDEYGSLTPIAKSVINSLDDQISFGSGSWDEVERIVVHIKEFLAIFEKKEVNCESLETLLADGQL
ncbi:MAG: hypothetical protein A2908_01540 [Candidatus Staskawiczbacteria bacterium RIFCSPLOWO2_01_FULL_38_12b]|uniref:Uncharacterized protein n=1 Tax=Candidatus Staskawiczbacteria bacterium RIFCSPLOWO2_01_FULL_38_12b TaxID=1802214 RepID=A0A1G2ICT4_9BACT|nr:MAG: hypothetical protein A2908_01540 [Candidatus Staskawiczbacteria bacterium RIFCSPLOWO2_01_FULL_38_12b]